MRHLSLLFIIGLFCFSDINAQCFSTQNYTVPGEYNYIIPGTAADTYVVEISTRGGDGGDFLWGSNPSSAGGSGATMSATFELKGGDNLFVIVGQSGFDAIGSPGGGGGGGGSAVIVNSTDVLIAAAAGGGGGQNILGEGAFASTNSPAQGGAGPGASGGGGFNMAGMTGQAGTGGGAGTLTSQGIGGTQGVVAGPGGNGFGAGGGGTGVAGSGGGGYKGGDGASTGSLNGKGGDSYVNTLYNSIVLTTTAGTTGGGFNVNGNVSIVCNSTMAGITPSIAVASQLDPSCMGLSDGSISVVASGGSGGYTFSINGGPFTANANFTGLAAGSYTIVVSDSSGAMATVMVTLTDPQELLINTIMVAPILCFGDMNGMIEVSGLNGTPPYMYQLNGGTLQSSGLFNNLAPAMYTVTVIDANGCSKSEPYTIGDATEILVTVFNVVDVTCNGLSDGSASFTASGGTGPYSYSLDGVNFQPSNTFQNLSGGNYTITVSDANNCNATENFTISEPNLTLTASTMNVNCAGANDGSVLLTAMGGIPAYEYSLDNITYQTSNVFSMLAPGTYIFYVRDMNLCISFTTVNISVQSNTNLAATSTNVTCSGSADGSASLVASGGIAPYEYSIDGMTYQVSPIFTSLAAGMYTFTVRDINQCTATTNVNITTQSNINVTAMSTNVSCFASADGTADITAMGGVAPYEYSEDGMSFQVSANFSSLAAGMYIFTVRDANLCTSTTSVNITEPPAVALGFTSSNASCAGAPDGSVALTSTGGVAPYEYSDDAISYQMSSNFGSLSPGMYDFTVRDANLCTTTINVTILDGAPLTVNVDQVTDGSCGNSDGSVTLSVPNGMAPITYTLGNDSNTTGMFGNLTAGAYTVTILDANNCTGSVSFNISQGSAIAIALQQTQMVSCNGASDAIIVASSTGGTGNLMYAIDGGTPQSSGSFENLGAGVYMISVTDDMNCSIVQSITVSEPSVISSTLMVAQEISCFGGNDGSVSIITQGGTGEITVTVNNVVQSAPAGNSLLFTGLSAGMISFEVMDENDCMTPYDITLNEPAELLLLEDTNISADCDQGTNGSVTLAANGGTAPYEYTLVTTNTTGVFTDVIAGNYTAQVTDANGCESSLAITVMQIGGLAVEENEISNVSCFDSMDGMIDLNVMGGTGPYAYSLGNEMNDTGIFTNLTANNYVILIEDSQGCQAQYSFSITQPEQLSIDIVDMDSGTIEVAGMGGTPDYMYSLDGVTFQDSGLFTDLDAGVYTITLMDSNGCTTTQEVNITVSSVQDTDLAVQNIVISPNPTSSDLNINFYLNESRSMDITIYNLVGSIVGYKQLGKLTAGEKAVLFDLSNLVRGTYLIKINSDQGVYTQKVIKVN